MNMRTVHGNNRVNFLSVQIATPLLFIAWALSPSVSWAWVLVSVALDAKVWRLTTARRFDEMDAGS